MVAFTTASINDNHSRENLVLSSLPNILHSMVAEKLWGVELDAVESKEKSTRESEKPEQ